MSVVVVGSLNADLGLGVERFPGPGETVLGGGGCVTPGGKGANQALAAALQGAAVTMVGAVGDDANAEVVTRRLREAGVDLSRVRTAAAPTGLAVVSVDQAGQNTIVVVPGANATVDADLVAGCADVLAGADVLVLQGEVPREAAEAAARTAAGRLVLNLAPVIALDPEAVRRADPLVVNEYEGRLVLREVLGDDADLEALDDVAVARRLLAAGVASVVMTLGPRGAVALSSGAPERVLEVASPEVPVVDTVGAGDAFVGALVAALDRGDDLAAAVGLGVRVGAYAVTGRGAQDSYPGPGDALPS